jgi:glutamine transport system permease protein
LDTFKLLSASLPSLMQGISVTIKIAAISLIAATFIGLVVGIINIGHNKILKPIAVFYISLIRGTPIIVQAFFLYFGIPSIANIKIQAFTAGIIVMTLNAGAYMAEIFRGGIQAVDKGQMEAARSLGLPYNKAMIKVVLPQAVRKMIPAIINQFIISIKDTSILTVIGIRELTQSGEIIIAATYKAFTIWSVVAVMYFILITILSVISKKVERCLNV